MTSKVSVLWRTLKWLSGLSVLGMVTLVLTLQFWILPNLDRWRVSIARSVSHAVGQTITLGRIDANWQGWHPAVRIQSIQVFDPQNKPLLYLRDVKGELSWISVVLDELRLANLTITNQAFALRLDRNGTLWLAGIALNRNSQHPSFADWLLKQQHVQISHATLSWQNEQRPAPMLYIQEVNLDTYNLFGHHTFHISATPPALIAHPLSVDGEFTGRHMADLSSWQGKLHLMVNQTDLAQWKPWVTLPLGIQRGYGNIDLTLQFARSQLIEASANLLLQQLSLQTMPDRPRIDLISLSGLLQWKRLGLAQSMELKKVSLRSTDYNYLAPFDFYLRLTPSNRNSVGQGLLRASDIDLQTLTKLSRYLPLDAIQRTWLDQNQPTGQLSTINANWQGVTQHIEHFSVSGKFSDLGITSTAQHPGFSGISGMINGNENTGYLSLNSRHIGLDLSNILFEPHVTLNTLTAQLHWQKQDQAYRFSLSQASVANNDFMATLYGNYQWQVGQPGIINLSGDATHGNGAAVYHYLPLAIKEPAYNWLRSNLLGGHTDAVHFHVQGNLAHYPFHNDSNGELSVYIKVADASLRANPDFPPFEHVNGEVWFSGAKMTVQANSAMLYHTKISNITAEVPDLFSGHTEKLEINGHAQGDVSDFIRFVNNSPIDKVLEHLTTGANGAGNVQLSLHLQLPFFDMNHPTVAGELNFNHDRFVPADNLPVLENVNGTLDFTQTGITAHNITCQLFGHPASLSSQTQQGLTQISLQGQLLAADLPQWLDSALAAKFSGQTDWHAQLNLLHGHVGNLSVDSNLTGMAIRLPAPFNKAANLSWPLHMTTQALASGQTLISAQLDQLVNAQLLISQTGGSAHLDSGALQFGGMATLPTSTGLSISGQLPLLDVDSWMGALPTNSNSALPITDVHLDIAHMDLFQRSFAQVSILAHNTRQSWHAVVKGPVMQGEVNWSPVADGIPRGHLDAHFTTLTIPATHPAPPQPADTANTDWPELSLSVDNLHIDQRALGRLNVHAQPIANGINFDHIELTQPDSTFTMSAIWHPHNSPQTSSKIRLVINDIGKFIGRFGEANTINKGHAVLSGQANWNGAPQDIPIASLNGQFTLSAQDGQFLKIEPGAAKLLGVLSLQDLPRHLMLNFNDVFSDGFAFDDISATLHLNHGIIHSDDFVMQGPAATVDISGDVDLIAQTQQLLASVSPKLSEGVALASTLFGGPVVGLGILAVQKLFSNPLGHAVSFDYTISGLWSNPQISKIGLDNL